MFSIVFALGVGLVCTYASVIEKRSASVVYDLKAANDGQAAWKSSNPFITLDNGVYFIVGNDGDFGVYDSGGGLLWKTQTTGYNCYNGGCQLQFQGDGNLVLYDYSVNPPNPFWSTGTNEYTNHPNRAVLVEFANTDPYLSLYASNEDCLYESSGTQGFEMSNGVEGSEPSGNDPPGGNNPSCNIDCVIDPNSDK